MWEKIPPSIYQGMHEYRMRENSSFGGGPMSLEHLSNEELLEEHENRWSGDGLAHQTGYEILRRMRPDWRDTAKELPPENKYVLARHNRGTWHDSTDQENVNCVLVKLVRGITEEDRVKMKSGELPDPVSQGWCLSDGVKEHKRSNVYRSEDVHGNNLVPYYWKSFGPDSFFGQTITHWMPLPPAPTSTEVKDGE
jgi:hypothetical protein